MAKTNDLVARVRYVDGRDSDRESYVIDIYDEDSGWETANVYYFARSADCPDDEEKSFIPYSIVPRIFELMDKGYQIHISRDFKDGDNT